VTNQRKCHDCGKWTDSTEKYCVFCDATLDPLLKSKEEKVERERRKREQKILSETKFEKHLRRLQESEKPIHKVSFRVLNIAFTIYMGTLSFFIWLIALISG
jgi:wobble nucleotide-excising tRNase